MSLFTLMLLGGVTVPVTLSGDRSLKCTLSANPGSVASGGKLLWVRSDNTIQIDGLQDAETGTVESTADIELTLVDAAGDAVTGVTWPLAMTNLAPGRYRVVIPQTATLEAGRLYTVQATITTADGQGNLYVEEVLTATVYPGEP